MRRLVLMRHAEAEASHPAGDKARELTPEGRARAQQVGQELAGLGLQHALVSAATRTQQTFQQLGLDVPSEVMEVLYREGADTMLQRISETDPGVTGLLVVAHEPAIPMLGSQLAYASDHRKADDLRCFFPTASFIEFTFDGDWRDLTPEQLSHVRLERIERGQAR